MSASASSGELQKLIDLFEEAGVMNLQWKPIGIWLEYADDCEDSAGDALAALLERLQDIPTRAGKRLYFGHFCEALEAAQMCDQEDFTLQ